MSYYVLDLETIKKRLVETIKKIVIATTAVAATAGIAGNVTNFVMGKELRRQGLIAEGASVNNRLASMMYDKNSTAFGALAMNNGLYKMHCNWA